MPLTTCPDCGGTVSTRAASCPSCGCPSGRAAPPRPRRVQEIESTGKGWKALQLLGSMAIVAGLIQGSRVVWGEGDADPTTLLSCVGLLVVGSVTACLARMMAWWYHG